MIVDALLAYGAGLQGVRAMRPQQPVRDRSTSLWRSAVRETFRKRDEDAATQGRIEHGTSLQAQSVDKNKPLDVLAKATFPNDAAAQKKAIENAKASGLAFQTADAHIDDTPGQTTLFGQLKDLVANFSD